LRTSPHRPLRLFLQGALILLLAGCSQSSRSGAIDSATDNARERVEQVRSQVGAILAGARFGAEAESQYATGNWMVLASSSDQSTVRWDIVVVESGQSGGGVGTLTVAVRACLRLSGSVGRSDVEVVDILCPPSIENSNRFGGYDETVELYS
jgi:hypothetical protein